jgi:predicted permease
VLTRQHEFAVQAALGAGRGRLARQLILEALVLAAAGGALGLLFAYYGASVLRELARQFLPSIGAPVIDLRIIGASIAACVVCGVMLGLLPAALVARGSLGSMLRSYGRSGTGGRGGGRARSMLVVVQTSLCVALLVSAGLLGKSLLALQRIDLGYDTSGVLTFELSLPRSRYASDTVQNQLYSELETRLRALPGVSKVATASGMPMASGTQASLGVSGRAAPDGQLPQVAYYSVSDEYFDLLRVPLRRGRWVDGRGSAREVVINETMARRHWPNEDPIGARVRLGPVQTGPWIEVVGVVADMRDLGPADSVRAIAFGHNRTFSWSARGVLIRTAGDPTQHSAAVRRIVASLDPTLPVMRLRTYDEIRRLDLARERLNTTLLGVFSVVSLLLAGVGIYGITASFVAARMREFGVRMALGAGRREVLGAAMGTGLRLTAVGLVVGLALAAALTRLLASAVHGIHVDDPAVYIVVCLTLAAAALLANWLPARRATQVDPVTALRSD